MFSNGVKTHYAQKLESVHNFRDYENARWGRNDIQRGYFEMTHNTIERLSNNVRFLHCIEVGPGPGTWTKIFIKKHPKARFDLVDTSEKMLTLAKEHLFEKKNIRYYESDVMSFKPDRTYDFFFSSRTFEYIEPKDEASRKIASLCQKGSQGILITKMPKPFHGWLKPESRSSIHTKRISPHKLKKLLEINHCTVTGIYPTTMNFPMIRSAKLNWFLYRVFSKKNLSFLSQLFTESYCITFKKQ